MTAYEKNEIKRLPRKYRPMGAMRYLFNSILYLIPVLGWIFVIAHAISDRQIVRRSYARFFALVDLAVILLFVLALLDVISIVGFVTKVAAFILGLIK